MVDYNTFAEYLKQTCSQNGINLNEEQLQKFYIYLQTLQRWNKVHNLTALRDWKEIALRHFCDSLTLVKFFEDIGYNPLKKSLADVGSGAGFPGVPLKIYYGNVKVCLIENVSKKCSFLSFLKTKLKEDYEVFCDNAENFPKKCDVALARALEVKGKKVSPLKYADRLLTQIGSSLAIIMAGKKVKPEQAAALGFKVYTLSLPSFEGMKILYKWLKG